jgi:multicomponent Na+:H+ antiporter subunit B
MIRNSLIIILIAIFGWFLFSTFSHYETQKELNPTAAYYNKNEASEVGAANVVTAIVVTYRGLDTLGEVTVLFLTTVIIGFMFKNINIKSNKNKKQSTSELLVTGSRILIPGSIILGVYVFINGHLTPGGGFQGGAIIGTATVLLALADPYKIISEKLMHTVESVSGIAFVFMGILGLLLAGGFLDNRFLPLGNIGDLISAGAIPIIYSLIGLKVGAELSGIICSIHKSEIGD